MSPSSARTLVLLLATSQLLAVACSSESPPDELVDGTDALLLSIDLEDVDLPTLLGVTRVVAAAHVDARNVLASCLQRGGWDDWPSSRAVRRVGALGESITFTNHSHTGLYACDDSSGPRAGSRRWCGLAFGQLTNGLLRDPRLDLGGCTTSDGRPVAFAWITPGPRTKYVVVRQDDFAEAYAVAGGLPVRVTTARAIDTTSSSATFNVSEHGRDGRLLRTYGLEAQVAG